MFVVTVGEIDPFPATMGFAAWVFALLVGAGINPLLAIAGAMLTGLLLGSFVGALVVYGNLSSVIATLGMNFMVRWVIQIITQGKSVALVSLMDSPTYRSLSVSLGGFPVQMPWALSFVIVAALLYSRHRVGARLHCVGDNPDSARRMASTVSSSCWLCSGTATTRCVTDELRH